jgi:Na+-transporting methylmalonyl-CoA/oxaloacetate decarboxylase gamma subunit
MSQAEGLVVTALGMSVVFVGLVLCIGFIEIFRRVTARISGGAAPGPSVQAPEPSIMPPVPADVLAVMVAVLEVERALYVGRYRSRLTLRRPGPPAPIDAGERS